jgi:flavin-dependent dehydrogenase
MTKTDPTYDVLVLGGGPSGATAAICLAQAERSVLLLEAAPDPLPAGALAWVSAQWVDLLETLKLPREELLARPFQQVRFHTAMLDKEATPAFMEPAGYIVQRGTLRNALIAQARACGAEVRSGTVVQDLAQAEGHVELALSDEQKVRGKLLLLATGHQSPLIPRAGFARPGGTAILTGQVEAALPEGKIFDEPSLGVVLGLEREGSFATYLRCGNRVAISLNWLGDPAAGPRAFAKVCKDLASADILQPDLAGTAASVRLAPSPASLALDMDTHVGKHTLLIGDAGGFVAAISNEGVYPAMWSAQLATEVVLAALNSNQSQDELMSFEQQWRMTMAEYLRPPNTDMQFLLPLVFSNQPMADRLGAAFFTGETI